jgi:N-acetylmuramoyl-L-alanine amidase
MSKKVFIGVGHGGSDPGAVANGFEEADLNLAIALACQTELVRHGVIVQMSRTKDENDPLSEEINECNVFNPDFAIDIHNNAGGGDGAEVFHTYLGGQGKVLAENILTEIKAIGQNSRGLKTRKNSRGTDYFGFIRDIKAPSIIVECAFVDNKKDLQIIDTTAEQKAMGVAIAKGILKTLGIAYKTQSENKTSNVIWQVVTGSFKDKNNAVNRVQELKAKGFDSFIQVR